MSATSTSKTKTAREWTKVFAQLPLLSTASIGLLGGLLGSAAGCAPKEEAQPPVVQVQTAVATRQSIAQHVTGDAVLAPVAEAAISPRITAPVRRFYVNRGSKVKSGQLL